MDAIADKINHRAADKEPGLLLRPPADVLHRLLLQPADPHLLEAAADQLKPAKPDEVLQRDALDRGIAEGHFIPVPEKYLQNRFVRDGANIFFKPARGGRDAQEKLQQFLAFADK